MDAEPTGQSFALALRSHRIVWSSPAFGILKQELEAEGISRCLLISSDRLARRFDQAVDEALRELVVDRFIEVVPHVPKASATSAIEAAQRCDARGLLVIGGGSSLDTAKAVSNRLALPIVAIPTNFSGSEVTWNFGLTVDGVKQTVRNPAVLPKIVIYDPALIGTLPVDMAVCSGINAVAHAVEALYAPQANPFTEALAFMGISKVLRGLSEFIATQGQSPGAAAQCLAGAWLCGEVLSQVGMGLHHRICHVLGGTFGLPHAQVHTVLLPYVLDWNITAAPVLEGLSNLVEGPSPAQGLARLSVRGGAPASLESLGLESSQITEVAKLALQSPVSNPRPVSVRDVEAILVRAHVGALVGGQV